MLTGSLEAIAAIESLMEQIASTVGIDAMEVKLNNTDKNQHPRIPEFWTAMQTWASVETRKQACKTFNEVRLEVFL